MRPQKAISLAGFEQTFERDPDPWSTFSSRDELVKRNVILHALGPRKHGRLLELGSGNGAHSVALARKSLRMHACEGTDTGFRLTASALRHDPRAHAHRLILPGRFPGASYDAVVISELLYYLDNQTLLAVAQESARRLRTGGTLVLAHHKVQFDDAAQITARVHERFLALIPRRLVRSFGHRSRFWRVEAFHNALY